MHAMKISAVLVTLVLAGCGSEAPSTADTAAGQSPAALTPDQPLPIRSGRFRGHYVVPAPPNLAAAGRYTVDSVEWSFNHGIATLRYYLPIGLVGGSLEVEFSGELHPGDTSAVLEDAHGGTATCTARDYVVTCHEIFEDLGQLPISMDVVKSVAAKEYAGPVEDRVAVANLFPSDPIGFVDFSLTRRAE